MTAYIDSRTEEPPDYQDEPEPADPEAESLYASIPDDWPEEPPDDSMDEEALAEGDFHTLAAGYVGPQAARVETGAGK